MMTSQQFADLLQKWRDGTLSEPETDRLLDAWQTGAFREATGDLLETYLEAGDLPAQMPLETKERILAGLRKQYSEQEHINQTMVHRVHFLKTAWFRWAAAIIIFFGIGTYIFTHTSQPDKEVAVDRPSPKSNDVMPGGNKAILKLADGSEIILDNAVNGPLAKQSGANIEKRADGQVIYSFNKASVDKGVSYNTMSTPRGGQYQLILPDGSKVWLNAQSSITFPTAFTGNKRDVVVSGEAYFEVAKNAAKPFRVKAGNDEIQVLGTEFNINNYPDEYPSKTSLVNGAIKIHNIVLKAGQAFIANKIIQTNLEEDIAWKNGLFSFNNASVKEVMNQVVRWYDVEVKYEGKIPDVEVNGQMGRDLTLNNILRILKGLEINFRLEGKTIIVSSLKN